MATQKKETDGSYYSDLTYPQGEDSHVSINGKNKCDIDLKQSILMYLELQLVISRQINQQPLVLLLEEAINKINLLWCKFTCHVYPLLINWFSNYDVFDNKFFH